MDKVKQWTVLTAVAAVAVLAGGWFLLVSPQRSHASALREQASTQEAHNQQLTAQLASLKAQHKDLPEVQAQLAKLGVQLPDNPGLATLVRELSAAADDAGANLVSLAPGNPQFVDNTFDPATGTVSAAAAAPAVAAPATSTDTSSTGAAAAPAPVTPAAPANSGLAYVPVVVTVNSGYFQVEQFLSNVEALKRAFLVTGLNIVPGQPPKPSASGSSTGSTSTAGTGSSTDYDGHLTVTLTGRVFMHLAPTVPAAPVAPVAPTSTDTTVSK